MITLLLILALIIAVIAVIFALQNTAAVSVSFFVWQFNQSLALVLLLAAFVGVIIGFTDHPARFDQNPLAVSCPQQKNRFSGKRDRGVEREVSQYRTTASSLAGFRSRQTKRSDPGFDNLTRATQLTAILHFLFQDSKQIPKRRGVQASGRPENGTLNQSAYAECHIFYQTGHQPV